MTVLAAVAIWWWIDGFSLAGESHTWEREALPGTWTEKDGSPGNFVQLRLEPHKLETAFGTVTALEGRATFHGQFGVNEETPVIWNFENYRPMRLNIVFAKGAGAGILAVGFQDRDHVRMRFVHDIGTAMRPDVLEHPEAKQFVRVRE